MIRIFFQLNIKHKKLKQYEKAKADFEQAIKLAPENGSYYLNLSRCCYMMDDLSGARKYAVQSSQLGSPPDEHYKKMIGID